MDEGSKSRLEYLAEQDLHEQQAKEVRRKDIIFLIKVGIIVFAVWCSLVILTGALFGLGLRIVS